MRANTIANEDVCKTLEEKHWQGSKLVGAFWLDVCDLFSSTNLIQIVQCSVCLQPHMLLTRDPPEDVTVDLNRQCQKVNHRSCVHFAVA